MAILTAQTVAKKLEYQADAKNNIQEAPGTGNIAGPTGSVAPASGESLISGTAVVALTIPQPGKGFPTGKVAGHTAGTYPVLVDTTVQQSTDSVAGQGTATPVGMQVSADLHVQAGTNDLQNYIASDAGENLVPTPPASAFPAAGLSQAPERE